MRVNKKKIPFGFGHTCTKEEADIITGAPLCVTTSTERFKKEQRKRKDAIESLKKKGILI